MICSRTGWNSGDSNLSASSIIIVLTLLKSATFFCARSRIRPGVATTIWTVLYKRMISSLRDVPPVVTIHWTPICFPISLTMADVWSANSRVGIKMRTWICLRSVSVFSRHGMMYAAVLPVPFLARAKTLRSCRMIGIASSWIGDGRSNPFSNIPMRSSRFKKKSSNSRPFVSVTSSVLYLVSFLGWTRPSLYVPVPSTLPLPPPFDCCDAGGAACDFWFDAILLVFVIGDSSFGCIIISFLCRRLA
mmetsp:Transcript_35419/g.85719  ORF Transcript_35419/g.85719 Transcript_35419/m.85719 type:complete len:247 (-) Transcript_35419:423-1163(-)